MCILTYRRHWTKRVLLQASWPSSLANLVVNETRAPHWVRPCRNAKRRTVARAAKTIITEEDADERHQFLCQLPAQGGMARSWEETSPELWVKAVHGLPPEPLKFALNASLGTLPTNANLHTVGQEDQRHLQPVQGTPAVSHPYPQQLTLRRYSQGHEVLKVFGDFSLHPHFSMTIDHLTDLYNFPHHITPTKMRPEIMWWTDRPRELWLFELTISYKSHICSRVEKG